MKVMKIIFFDGVCGLCNRSVDFLMKHDTAQSLRYAPLQGEAAKEFLPSLHRRLPLSSMVYIDGEKIFTQSTAILLAASSLGGIYSLMRLFLLIPRFIRDRIYSWISQHRYQWFQKLDSCRLPTQKERALFLD